MASFIHYCKHCNAKLRVDASFLGKVLPCPACHADIYFDNNDLPDAPGSDDMPSAPDAPETFGVLPPQVNQLSESLKTADQTAEKSNEDKALKDKAPEDKNSSDMDEFSADDCEVLPEDPAAYSVYFWGRLGVKSVKIIAVLILLLGGFFTFLLIAEYINNVRKIPEFIRLEELNASLSEKEKKLNSEFSNAVTLLKGEGMINAGGVLDGMVLPADACMMPAPMPYNVFSKSELRVSLRVLRQYQQRTLKVKQAFIDNFGKLLQSVELPTARSSSAGQSKNEIVITTGGMRSNFYFAESVQRRQLDMFIRLLGEVIKKRNAPDRKGRIKFEDLKRSRAVADFVSRRLFSQSDSTTVVRGRMSNGSSDKNSNIQQDELSADVLQLNKIIQDLSGEWQVDYEIAGMEQLLVDISKCIKIFELKRSQLRWLLCKQLVVLYLMVLGGAFALLVLGDFLRGHFDMADIMRRRKINK